MADWPVARVESQTATMSEPYYSDDQVTLYLGDCREITDWLAADVLVTDPPYGRRWRQGDMSKPYGWKKSSHSGIIGDDDPGIRDWALGVWADKPAVAFGDLMLPPPPGTKQVAIFQKVASSGLRGATGGFRRDVEGIYLIGPGWPSGIGGDSSVLKSNAVEFSVTIIRRNGHPHSKPVDVMETLISHCPQGIIADPFAGSGSSLVAARNLGRRAIGVEIDERYCETAARRLSQGVLMGAL